MKYSPAFQRQLEYAAYDCAQRGTSAVVVDHLLLGLYREDFPLIDGVLASFQVDSIVVLDRLLKEYPDAARATRPDEVQLSPEALQAIHLAEGEAESMGHDTVLPAHTLLGILAYNRDRLQRYFIREAIFRDREDEVLDRVRELVAWFRFGGEERDVEFLDRDTIVAIESLPNPADDDYRRFTVKLRMLKRFRSK